MFVRNSRDSQFQKLNIAKEIVYIMKKEENSGKIRKGIRLIYLNQFIRGIAFSLVGIFIPIYLLNLGYSLDSVLIYFLLFHLLTFVFTPITLLLSRKLGYKFFIILSVPLVIIFLFLLQSLESATISVYLIAILAGIENAFYFIPLHAFFVRLSESQKRGTQFSNYAAIGMLAGLFGPLIGGFIAVIFGFKSLFYIVMVFISISILPLIGLVNVKPNTKLTLKGIWHLTKTHKRFFIISIADDIRGEIEGIVWPIFIYISLKSIISVGWVASFASFGTIVFTLFIGRFYDRKSKYLFLKLGGLLYALLWLTRIYWDMPLFLFGASLLAGFFALMIGIPFNAIFYDKAAEHKDPDEFIVFRETPKFIGRIFIWGLMIILVNEFVLAFILAGLASLFFFFLRLEPFRQERGITSQKAR